MSKKKKRKSPDASLAANASNASALASPSAEESLPLWRALLAEPVALGLSVLVILRPWRDGLTFPAFNAYFFAVALIFGALLSAAGLLRPRPVRAPVPLAILAAFLGVAWLTGLATFSRDPTTHGLQRIAIYLILFALATNGLRTRRAITIVLGAIIVGWLLNSIWTIFHYDVMLKGMRQVLKDNPSLLRTYFRVTTVTPELKHRLESNRAFGTFLFPNALGAYLILGIPIAAALLPNAISALRSLSSAATPKRQSVFDWVALAIGLSVGAIVLAILYFGNEFIGLARPGQRAPIAGAYWPFVYFVPIGALFGGGAAWFVVASGAPAFGRLCTGIGVPLTLISSFVALWLSYSRGAGFALIATSAIAAFCAGAVQLPRGTRFLRGSAAAGALVLALLAARHGAAQNDSGYQLPDPSPSSLLYEERKYGEALKEAESINIEGSSRELGSLGDLSTLHLRETYWQVGMKMLLANLWTGVGLGNFQTAYPHYQFLGAGDVETAHNDYLQYFCETGLFGGGLFLAFWVYFGVWGSLRILEERDTEYRRWMAGLYAGGLAFALHSFLDFNFQNPSLSMEAFVVAGVFYALTWLPVAESESRVNLVRSRIAAAVLGVVVTFCTSSVVQTYLFDHDVTQNGGLLRYYAVGDRKPLNAKLEAAQFVFGELTRPPKYDANKRIIPRGGPLFAVERAIPDETKLKSVGELYVPVPETPGAIRRIRADERTGPDTYILFRDADLPQARQFLVEQCEQWIGVLAEWDKSYPYDPEFSLHIFSWYDMLFTFAADPAAQRRYALEAERWAKLTVDRSPKSPWWWQNYAKALWMRGRVEQEKTQQLDFYRTGLKYYRKAFELYPRSPKLASDLATALQKLGTQMAEKGYPEGKDMLAESQALYERAVVLDHYDQLMR